MGPQGGGRAVLPSTGVEPHLTVSETNVTSAGLHPHPRAVVGVIELVGLGAKRNERVNYLSVGQQRWLGGTVASLISGWQPSTFGSLPIEQTASAPPGIETLAAERIPDLAACPSPNREGGTGISAVGGGCAAARFDCRTSAPGPRSVSEQTPKARYLPLRGPALRKTATCFMLSEVKGERSQFPHRASSSNPAILAIKTSSDGQM